jgi:hypothetical protein
MPKMLLLFIQDQIIFPQEAQYPRRIGATFFHNPPLRHVSQGLSVAHARVSSRDRPVRLIPFQ